MIFCAKNEEGTPTWKLIQDGTKTVTRRIKPISVGKVLAVQPGRAKKAVGYIKVISCEHSGVWLERMFREWCSGSCRDCKKRMNKGLQTEAHKEGFDHWCNLVNYFIMHETRIDDTYRVEFIYLGEKKI